MKPADKLRYERSRYVVRRFVPALVLMLLLNIAGLAVDVSLVHWIATISGLTLAVYLFCLRVAAERKFPVSPVHQSSARES